MPELPEVETVRRHLEATVRGRRVRGVRVSGLRLRDRVPRDLARRFRGRALVDVRRHGKYLLLDFEGGWTLLSHLGMSGRWLFQPGTPAGDPSKDSKRRTKAPLPHVHARFVFTDGTELWFQDPRRFGLLRAVATERLGRDPSLAVLGADPVREPPSGDSLRSLARGLRVSIKGFLMDQRRLAGIGNIYASEILHRARVDPRTPAGSLRLERWEAIATETRAVLGEAIERFGTTFRSYRTLWNEPGAFGEQLRVYDRSGEPCLTCRTPIRRIVQGARSTYFCPRCQPRSRSGGGSRPSAAPRRAGFRRC